MHATIPEQIIRYYSWSEVHQKLHYYPFLVQLLLFCLREIHLLLKMRGNNSSWWLTSIKKNPLPCVLSTPMACFCTPLIIPFSMGQKVCDIACEEKPFKKEQWFLSQKRKWDKSWYGMVSFLLLKTFILNWAWPSRNANLDKRYVHLPKNILHYSCGFYFYDGLYSP